MKDLKQPTIDVDFYQTHQPEGRTTHGRCSLLRGLFSFLLLFALNLLTSVVVKSYFKFFSNSFFSAVEDAPEVKFASISSMNSNLYPHRDAMTIETLLNNKNFSIFSFLFKHNQSC